MTRQALESKPIIFSIQPTALGFGWIAFEGPSFPIGWGIVSARAKRHKRLLPRFQRLLDRYSPSVLVVEAFEGASSDRSPRMQDLYREFMFEARRRGMRDVTLERKVVASYFGQTPTATRFEIAEQVAAALPEIDHRKPRKRKPWNSEDARQSLFDAAALTLTYFAVMGEN